MVWRFFAIVIGLGAIATPALASSPLPLPPPSAFAELPDLVRPAVDSRRWVCAASDDAGDEDLQNCPCVDFESRQTQIFLYGVEPRHQNLGAAQLVIRHDAGTLWAQDIVIEGPSENLTITYERGLWTTDNSVQRIGHGAGTLRFGTAQPEIFWEDIRWFESPDGAPSFAIGGGCDSASPEDATQDEGDIAIARAESARWTDGGWQVQGLKVAPPLGPPLAGKAAENQRVAGALFPRIIYHGEGARFIGAYFLGRWPLSLRLIADGAPEPALGLGAAVFSRPAVGTSATAQMLSADVVVNRNALTTAYLGGQASVGRGRQHVMVDTDELVVPFGDGAAAPADPLRRRAVLRSWRQSSVAASLGTSAADLQIGAVAVDEPSSRVLDASDWRQWNRQLWLRYGTRLDLGAPGRLALRATHRELGPPRFDARNSHLTLRYDRIIGDLRRIFMRPTLRGQAAFGTAQSDAGAETASQLSTDAMVDVGVALRGRPGPMVHDLRLAVFGAHGGRLLEPADPEDFELLGGGPQSSARQPFGMVGAVFDQQFWAPGGWRLKMPLGLSWQTPTARVDWTPLLEAGLDISKELGRRRIRLAVDGACRQWSCQIPGLSGRLQIDWSDSLKTTHIVRHGPDRRTDGLGYRRQLQRTSLIVNEHWWGDAPSLMHLSRLGLTGRHWRADLALSAVPGDLAAAGLAMSLGRQWSALGWGIALEVAARPGRRQWATTLGLTRNLRAF